MDPTTEAALSRLSSKEAAKDGKTVQEYDAKLVDKNGRTLTYNSVDGVIASNSKNIYYNYALILFCLFSLL